LEGAFGVFRKDLVALPEEAYTKKFNAAARTVCDIVYECNLVNDHIGLTMRGEPLFDWPEGWVTAPDDFQTKEAVLAAFDASAKMFMDTVAGYTQEEMVAPLKSDDSVTDRFERCRFVALHLWYHSGQLNFIQTLLGDDVFHWMK
jgi:hypothetical protein